MTVAKSLISSKCVFNLFYWFPGVFRSVNLCIGVSGKIIGPPGGAPWGYTRGWYRGVIESKLQLWISYIFGTHICQLSSNLKILSVRGFLPAPAHISHVCKCAKFRTFAPRTSVLTQNTFFYIWFHTNFHDRNCTHIPLAQMCEISQVCKCAKFRTFAPRTSALSQKNLFYIWFHTNFRGCNCTHIPGANVRNFAHLHFLKTYFCMWLHTISAAVAAHTLHTFRTSALLQSSD